MNRFSAFASTGAFVLLGAVSLAPAATSCPALRDGVRVFPEQTIGIVGNLEVDTDGAAASYSPGDHGFSYIAEGVDRLVKGKISGCSSDNQKTCNADWAAAEKADFGPGTQRFCSFAIAVDPWREGQKVTTCRKGLIIGDSVGRPRLGAPYPAAAGGTTRPYASETSLHQLIGGTKSPVDLASVPGVVVPTDRGDLIGSIAWVKFGNVSTFAIAADGGPNFHEGSLALHQILQGSVRQQPIGPIPAQLRCGDEEHAVKPPFTVIPWPSTDTCTHGHRPTQPADIRAKSGIADGVHILLLASVHAPMKDGAVTVPMNAESFEGLARKAGYSDAKLADMDRCLSQPDSGRSPRKPKRRDVKAR